MSISPRQAQQDNVNWTSANTARQCQFHLGNHSQTRSTCPRQTQPDNVNFTSANTARQCQLHLGKHCKTMSTSPRQSLQDNGKHCRWLLLTCLCQHRHHSTGMMLIRQMWATLAENNLHLNDIYRCPESNCINPFLETVLVAPRSDMFNELLPLIRPELLQGFLYSHPW